MRRRRLLSAIAVAGIAGCTTPAGSESDPDASTADESAGDESEPDGSDRAAVDDTTLAERGFPATICEEEPMDEPGIYAIDDPAVDDNWDGLDVEDRYGDEGQLTDDSVVIGVERDGEVRAYPLSIVWYHEAVNDDLGGPLLVTYCPLCRSAMVADRTVDGEPAIFEVTGNLWTPPELQTLASEAENRTFGVTRDEAERVEVRDSGNLVLVDDVTGSFWSQIIAEAICGPRTGDRLDPVAVSVVTWEEWRTEHPEGGVLLPPPHSGTERN